VLRLYGVAIYGAFIAALMGVFLGSVNGIVDFLRLWLDVFRHYWFLHAYVIMMMFAPLVDHTIEYAKKVGGRSYAVKNLTPVLALVFVWSFFSEIRWLKWLVPVSNGITQLSGSTLIGIYVAARLIRMYEEYLHLRTTTLIILVLGIGAFISLGHFGFYSSPFALVFAAGLFLLFRRLPQGIAGNKFILLMSPSMFSIYLIHTNRAGLILLKKIYAGVMNCADMGILTVFVVGIIVFVLSMGIDMPRRIALSTLSGRLSR